MNAKSKLAVTFGILVIVSLTTWLMMSPDEPAPTTGSELTPITPPSASGADQAPEELGLPVAPEEREHQRVAATTAAPGWTVAGRALRGDGPFPELALVARLWEGTAVDVDRDPDRERELTTDADGEFSSTFEDLDGPALVIVQPTGVFEDGQEYSWRPARAATETGEGLASLVLYLHLLDAAFVGTVRDAESKPIAGASVRVYDEPVLTDAEGRYRLVIRSRSEVYLYAEADGFAQTRSLVSGVTGDEERVVDFELKAEFRVEGVVRDRFGQPVQDALVTTFHTNRNDVSTDYEGCYVLGHLDPGRPEHMVNVRKEGWVLTQATVRTDAGRVAKQDFTLDRGVRVEGRVVDTEGAPVAGASLYIGFSPHAFNRLDAESSADGSFVFPSVQRGPETLVVQHDDFGSYRQTITLPEDEDLLAELEIILEPGHFIGGHVRDEAGEPLAGVSVTVRHFGAYLDVRGVTDEKGHFRLEGLPGSDLTLSFYATQGAFQRVRHELDVIDVETLEITMAAAGGIAGRVLDGVTGRPIEAFRIRFVEPELLEGEQHLWGYGASWSREGWLFESTDGFWDTSSESDLTPGAVIGIEASAEGYASALAPHVVVSLEPDPDALVQRLFRGVVVSGLVVDAAGGEPLEGALVKLYRAGETITLRGSEDTHDRQLVRTDSVGRFRFANVPAGEHRLLVLDEAHPNHLDGPFEVLPEADVERVIEIPPGAQVSGRLRDIGGAARAGVVIELAREGTGRSGFFQDWEATTDAEGRYRFDTLPSGAFRIGPRIGDGETRVVEYQLRFELSTVEERELDLEPPGTATLVGRLGHDGELPELLIVQLIGAKDSESGPRTRFGGLARTGEFTLRGLTPGTYGVIVHGRTPGSRVQWMSAAPVEVTLTSGASSEVWIEMAGTEH